MRPESELLLKHDHLHRMINKLLGLQYVLPRCARYGPNRSNEFFRAALFHQVLVQSM